MIDARPFDAFLSHSSADKPWVLALKNELQRRGIRIWVDHDEIRPGDVFVHALEQGLADSKTMVLVVSPESMASGWVREEYARALTLAQATNQPLRIIPAILRSAELPGFLSSRMWVDFRNDAAFAESIDRLAWGITGAPGPNDREHVASSDIRRPRSRLEIAALSVQERSPFPVIDVRLLNRTDDPILIHEISLVVLSHRTHFREISTSPPLFSSHVYHLLLDPVRPETVSKATSFVVNPKSADRFHVVAGAVAGAYLSGHDVLRVQVEDGLRQFLEAKTAEVLEALYYTPCAVDVTATLRLACNGSLAVESESFALRIEIDSHFRPGAAEEVVDRFTVLKQMTTASEEGADETLQILGRLHLEHHHQTEAEALISRRMSSRHIPTLVESASTRARLGNPVGIAWLLDAVSGRDGDVWLKVMAVRSLIRLSHFERRIYVDIMKGPSIPLKLEVLRVIALMREQAVWYELAGLIEMMDEVVQESFNTYAFSGAGERVGSLGALLDARRNRELEEVVRAIGAVGKHEGVALIRDVLNDERTYCELSYELLIACVGALGQIGSDEAAAELNMLEKRLSSLMGSHEHVANAIRAAKNGGDVETQTALALGRRVRRVPNDLVVERERDDFGNLLVEIDERSARSTLATLLGKHESTIVLPRFWFREPNQELIRHFVKRFPDLQLSSIHFHNTSPHLYISGDWTRHPRLRGRFHSDYPDDIQVLVHDGGPRFSDRRPEVVWVRVTEGAGDVFNGLVLNQPNQLRTVRQGDTILFIVPEGGQFPLRVSAQYLEERKQWTVLPCKRCGLTELFDTPSDLLRVVFPNAPPDAAMEMFTAFCGACGGIQMVLRKGSSLETATD